MSQPFFNAGYYEAVRGSYLMSDDGALRVDTPVCGTTYIGYSTPGAGESENLWKIKKVEEIGNITRMLYPLNEWGIPDKAYTYNWTDRASYTYLANVGSLSYPPTEISVYDAATNYSIPETRQITSGSRIFLKVVGGRLGSGATWTWYDDYCGGNVIGTGEELFLTISQTTTFYCKYTGGLNSSSQCVFRRVLIQ